MKKILFTLAVICFFTNLTSAQFQKVQKTSRPVTKTTPIMVNQQQLKSFPAGNGVPTKSINVGGGQSILVTLKTNPNTGSEPAFNKVNKASLPNEQSTGSTCVVNKVVFTAESTTFMNGNNSNQIKLYPGAIYTFEDFIGGGYNEIITGRNPIRIYTDQPVNVGGSSGITVNN